LDNDDDDDDVATVVFGFFLGAKEGEGEGEGAPALSRLFHASTKLNCFVFHARVSFCPCCC